MTKLRVCMALASAGAFAVVASWSGEVRAQQSPFFIFMETVACSQVPFNGCDVLNPENAENVFWAARFQILQRFCGSGNENAARQLLNNDVALEPQACREALALGGR